MFLYPFQGVVEGMGGCTSVRSYRPGATTFLFLLLQFLKHILDTLLKICAFVPLLPVRGSLFGRTGRHVQEEDQIGLWEANIALPTPLQRNALPG